MTTTHVRAQDTEERWLLYDASEHNLGRMAAKIAHRLIGKDRPTYTASEPGNTHIVVINAARARVSGKGNDAKLYKHYTGYPGGLREVAIGRVRETRPHDIVKLAVRRMLPKNRMGAKLLSCLKVYPNSDHPHTAQKPVKVETL